MIWNKITPSIQNYLQWIKEVVDKHPASSDNRLVLNSLQAILGVLRDPDTAPSPRAVPEDIRALYRQNYEGLLNDLDKLGSAVAGGYRPQHRRSGRVWPETQGDSD